MEKRLRSPNYPALSLRDAIEKARKLATEIGQRPADRSSVAIGMGYSGLSGTSSTAMSALVKYGLLEGRGENIAITDRAMAIIYPGSREEYAAALREAALEPELFRELAERFGDRAQNEDLLRNHLLRNKFAPNAVEGAISAWRETVELIGGFGSISDSQPHTVMEPGMEASQKDFSKRALMSNSTTFEAPDGFEIDRTNLDEGSVTLILPKNLSTDSVNELDYWIQGVMRRVKRRAKMPSDPEQN